MFANSWTGSVSGTTVCKAVVQNYTSSASTTKYYSTKLRKLIINDETEIGYGAISNIPSLEEVILNEGVTTIHEYAFKNDTGIESLTIPNSVKVIKNYFFFHISLIDLI